MTTPANPWDLDPQKAAPAGEGTNLNLPPIPDAPAAPATPAAPAAPATSAYEQASYAPLPGQEAGGYPPAAQPQAPYAQPQAPYAQPQPPYAQPQAPYAQPQAPYGQQQMAPQYGYQQSMMNPSEETTWASMSHWLGILIGFLGPLIIMLVKGDQSPRVKAAAVESLNFQITLMIGYFAAFVLSFVIIGVFLFPVLFILQILFPILGALSENKGIPYRYPFALRLVK